MAGIGQAQRRTEELSQYLIELTAMKARFTHFRQIVAAVVNYDGVGVAWVAPLQEYHFLIRVRRRIGPSKYLRLNCSSRSDGKISSPAEPTPRLRKSPMAMGIMRLSGDSPVVDIAHADMANRFRLPRLSPSQLSQCRSSRLMTAVDQRRPLGYLPDSPVGADLRADSLKSSVYSHPCLRPDRDRSIPVERRRRQGESDDRIPTMIEATTLWQLVERRAQATPDAIFALDEQERKISFEGLRAEAERVAAGLFERGVREDQIVAWILPTRISAFVLMCALSRLGVIQNPLVPIYREREVDFCLLRLEAAPPQQFGPFWTGWDRRTTIIPDGAVSIHHPDAGEKAISRNDDPLTVAASCITEGGPEDSHWEVDNWEYGTTEQGSSGAGLWDPASHLLVGFLSGGLAACDNDLWDCFGRFAVAWDGPSPGERLRDWLDPEDTGAQRVLGGKVLEGLLRHFDPKGLQRSLLAARLASHRSRLSAARSRIGRAP